MKEATLCFLINENKILLGMKKRGFGQGKYNGFGGKPQSNETILEAAVREMQEESNIKVSANHLQKKAELTSGSLLSECEEQSDESAASPERPTGAKE